MAEPTTPTAADLQAKPTTPIEPPASVANSAKGNEHFSDAMRRIGGDKVFEKPTEDTAPEAEGEEKPVEGEAKPDDTEKLAEKAKRPAKEKPIAVTPEAEQEQLKALAEKHGFILENGRVTTAERAKFREERRTHSEALKTAETNALSKIEEARKTFETELGMARTITAAIETGDANALAKALGREDWNKLQEHFLSHQADPNYKRVLELEEKVRQREEREKQEEAQRTEREQQQQRIQAQNQYKATLAESMKPSKDPLIASMAEDPLFINAIFAIQQAHYDGSQTVTPEQAIKLVPRGGQRSLYDEMKTLHERLSKAFASAAPAAPVVEAPPARKPAPKGPPPPATPKPSTLSRQQRDREWIEHARQRLDEAILEDRRAERTGQATRTG